MHWILVGIALGIGFSLTPVVLRLATVLFVWAMKLLPFIVVIGATALTVAIKMH